MRHAIHLLLAVLATAALVGAGQSITRAELKQRFEQRYPELQRLKRSGVAGETAGGLIAAVASGEKAAGDVSRIIEQENRDRATLYRLLAEDLRAGLDEPERSMMSPRIVAERNARRNFEKAGSDERLAVAEGIWITKRECPWIPALLALEDKGVVGETSEGFVARVSDADDRAAARVVDLENTARRERYEQIARTKGLPVDRVAREQAERYIDAAHRGVPVRRPDGTWIRTKATS